MILNYEQYLNYIKNPIKKKKIEEMFSQYKEREFIHATDFIQKGFYFVCFFEKNGDIIGITRVKPLNKFVKNNKKFIIRSLIIHTKYLGQGYCIKIIEEIINYFRKMRDIKLYLDVEKDNIPAVKCYLRGGFINESIVKHGNKLYNRMIIDLSKNKNNKTIKNKENIKNNKTIKKNRN
jgi:RimJ/RimL family protein N-acetyltransferase